MKYVHASLIEMKEGDVLKPKQNCEDHWGKTDFYSALECYRPSHMLSHKESIFMCSSAEDLDK